MRHCILLYAAIHLQKLQLIVKFKLWLIYSHFPYTKQCEGTTMM